ncbi:hypothetical protein MGU_06022 [Metarhizium guizhouense ARSEF 977]|uniref:Uncharacterized protein n=1 Tax=Metarhizium guizhouense (strain ARSEF 977) TaxID=1276136 RepID=A0A0B4GVU5_METGA|nr:hypothetical protein MGU_06022 [Metarhizium guizhouense ARSEF 977]
MLLNRHWTFGTSALEDWRAARGVNYVEKGQVGYSVDVNEAINIGRRLDTRTRARVQGPGSRVLSSTFAGTGTAVAVWAQCLLISVRFDKRQLVRSVWPVVGPPLSSGLWLSLSALTPVIFNLLKDPSFPRATPFKTPTTVILCHHHTNTFSTEAQLAQSAEATTRLLRALYFHPSQSKTRHR